MKTVFFLRHAKSSWADSTLSDIDRPLNKRGLRDAPFMAKLLSTKTSKIDLILSSPSVRTQITASFFANAFNINKENINYQSSLYHPSTQDVFESIHSIEEQQDTVLILGHNPAWTTIANSFSEDYIPNIPTCGIFKVTAAIDSWEDFTTETGKISMLLFPKMYF